MNKVLILGSGGLRIGQAGEFDYSGSQAIKALKEEGIRTILINPNIATVQTDAEMADEVYFQPLTSQALEKIIIKEQPNGILLSFGGQTALNLGLELEELGILKKHHVNVLGTSVETIRLTEDRDLFKANLSRISILTPQAIAVNSVPEALAAARSIGYPIMLRAGFSLGGLGSGKINSAEELKDKAAAALMGASQLLIEEYLYGWKEFEYEIVRDLHDQTLTICSMENLDPMGIHTGESIVVAPTQTLSNSEHQLLRNVAIRAARHFKIQGECNIQFALNPKTGEYRVIEMNARLSRSSALASKATGYPLAFVAAKLALGFRLDQIPNAITKKTTSFFEPALDYIVVKIPRWDTQKLKSADRTIGTEMKSVGEVMAIGRTFAEALQKGIRMLNIGSFGIEDPPEPMDDLLDEIQKPTDLRIFALYQFLRQGTVKDAQTMSQIDPWFLSSIQNLAQFENRLKKENLSASLVKQAKQLGFSDRSIGKIKKMTEEEVRSFRLRNGIVPFVKQIDTLAGEFDAETNYLYMSYQAIEHDIARSKTPPLFILGSGPYCIGSSVEFDWCAVNMARHLRKKMKEKVVFINSNPETVSTDFDESDRLYFEELTLERVRDIADFEAPKGIIVSVGGQIANNLAYPLDCANYPILGTAASMIDRAENRHSFSSLLCKLGIDQPAWQQATTLQKAEEFAQKAGYPLLIRPSYVLSGAAMNVVWSKSELKQYLSKAAIVSPNHPVVLSKFIENAKEFEIDGVAQNGDIAVSAISEHVENAGVHSGDATLVLPPQHLDAETIRRGKTICAAIVKALHISGPFNLQFIAKDDQIKVIECNVRASRSFPFVSKVTRTHFIQIAAECILNKYKKRALAALDLSCVGVKTSQFSYNRLKGADPIASVEMASTGEVAHIGSGYLETFFLSWLSTEQTLKGKRLLISCSKKYRLKLLASLKILDAKGWDIFATEGMHAFLTSHGVGSTPVYKVGENHEPNIATLITNQKIDLILNLPELNAKNDNNVGFKIRRFAIDHHIPLITNSEIAQIVLRCLCELNLSLLPVRSWKELTQKE